MEDLEDLVKKFLSDEEFTIRNALSYASVGLSKTTGAASEIIGGVGFSGHSYNDERKAFMAEHLGEMLFYWHVLASTVDLAPDEIVQQYIHSYKLKNNLKVDEQVNIAELMKHVKPGARIREKADEEQKRKLSEREFGGRTAEEARKLGKR